MELQRSGSFGRGRRGLVWVRRKTRWSWDVGRKRLMSYYSVEPHCYTNSPDRGMICCHSWDSNLSPSKGKDRVRIVSRTVGRPWVLDDEERSSVTVWTIVSILRGSLSFNCYVSSPVTFLWTPSSTHFSWGSDRNSFTRDFLNRLTTPDP